MRSVIRFRRRWSLPMLMALVVIGSGVIGSAAFDMRSSLVALVPSSSAPVAAYQAPQAEARVTFQLCSRSVSTSCVIDGDTIKYNGMTIRIADINAPETSEPKCPAEAALGQRATLRLLDLLNAGPFTVSPNNDGTGRDSDRYGRKLRIIERNGRSLGGVLVSEGLAHPWRGRRESWCG